jgi:hypothetical protein
VDTLCSTYMALTRPDVRANRGTQAMCRLARIATPYARVTQ